MYGTGPLIFLPASSSRRGLISARRLDPGNVNDNTVFSRIRSAAKSGFPILSPGPARRLQPHCSLIQVAYLLNLSRLAFSTAYHTTSYKPHSKINLYFDKKNWRAALPVRPPHVTCCSPAAEALLPARRGGAALLGQLITIAIFKLALFEKRTKCMLDFIYSLPLTPNFPIQSPSVSSGALGIQPCLEPVPLVPQPPSPVGVEQRPAPAPVPRPPARCSVKGCVFPAPLTGHTTCRYHELFQSEAELFQTYQPSQALLRHAPFGVPEYEPDDSRYRDRKRQVAEREAFQLDEPALGDE